MLDLVSLSMCLDNDGCSEWFYDCSIPDPNRDYIPCQGTVEECLVEDFSECILDQSCSVEESPENNNPPLKILDIDKLTVDIKRVDEWAYSNYWEPKVGINYLNSNFGDSVLHVSTGNDNVAIMANSEISLKAISGTCLATNEILYFVGGSNEYSYPYSFMPSENEDCVEEDQILLETPPIRLDVSYLEVGDSFDLNFEIELVTTENEEYSESYTVNYEYVDCVSLNGDLNGDGNWNVLDIAQLSNCVLAQNCPEVNGGCAGNINGDTAYNVLDIVTLANCILAQNCGG